MKHSELKFKKKMNIDPNAATKVIPEQTYNVSFIDTYAGCYGLGSTIVSLFFDFATSTPSLRQCMTYCSEGMYDPNARNASYVFIMQG
jgi:hypothetical protein